MSAPEWRHWRFCFVLFCSWCCFFLGVKNTLLLFNKEMRSLESLGTDPSHTTSSLPFSPPFPRRRFHSSAVFSHELLFCFPPTRAQLMPFIEGEKTNELLSWLVQTNFLRNISLLCKNWVQQRHGRVRQPPPVTGSWAAIACDSGASGSFISLLGLIWCLLKWGILFFCAFSMLLTLATGCKKTRIHVFYPKHSVP